MILVMQNSCITMELQVLSGLLLGEKMNELILEPAPADLYA